MAECQATAGCRATRLGALRLPELLRQFRQAPPASVSMSALGLTCARNLLLSGQECLLLAVMAYDRVVAISNPLRYSMVMNGPYRLSFKDQILTNGRKTLRVPGETLGSQAQAGESGLWGGGTEELPQSRARECAQRRDCCLCHWIALAGGRQKLLTVLNPSSNCTEPQFWERPGEARLMLGKLGCGAEVQRGGEEQSTGGAHGIVRGGGAVDCAAESPWWEGDKSARLR
ncbi:hypothetical protein QTO34_000294 [Cnephaeus nilssonii]|uniref:G-protein coupled receptors family 1 profile domain-containing protein n=1 Tax=Cnephaeus nilssonii TaxID=3371016 RepID=A0AA40LWE1_CNENI|nr:hypothetical protein QTO34_000294 [Eptesicus nilssonii]